MFSFSSPPHPSLYRPAFIPQTPSPLRTSYNANLNRMSNIKSSPLSTSTAFDSTENDENIFSPEQRTKSYFTTPSTVASNSSDTISKPTFTFEQTPSLSTTKFSYEIRARSASPAAQISKHATDSREKRKTMFLDRIRNRREDQRDDRMGDQILRMDYIKEKREWEEEMQRQEVGALEEGGDVDMMEEEMSPTEEKEIEELVDGYFQQPQDDRGGTEMERESDDEYDQLFMQLSADGGGMDMDMS